jgi:DNA-directed RNA polymerase subunit RPC12/RpoP
MQFFLYEIVARIVAIYLCFDCGRDVWHGYVAGEVDKWTKVTQGIQVNGCRDPASPRRGWPGRRRAKRRVYARP